MIYDVDISIPVKRRYDPGAMLARYHSVQFSPEELNPVYQFKLWQPTYEEMRILVKEDSAVLKYIKVGDILDMQYCMPGFSHKEIFKTKISHITKIDQKSSKEHFWIGLSAL
jgi:hypothetical protein